jgi:hypothetical protein
VRGQSRGVLRRVRTQFLYTVSVHASIWRTGNAVEVAQAKAATEAGSKV